jgi:hypothetical protein
MNVTIISKGNPISEGFKEYFNHRANLALGRHLSQIRSLRVCLEDTSNPRTGSERICRVEIAGEFGKRSVVVHDRNFKPAIDCALDVCARVVARSLQRADSEFFAITPHQRLAS